eukprot:TRINITY_DN10063_c0_g1_i1.p1 TRINITY_DN10063_c0_g1~~TRINITY_DN10063_c0_g1_i1.p1  ORF type:complete len:162 (+),score=12.27 TRINITY_DN10063_c0_g1_i1:57-542(+)
MMSLHTKLFFPMSKPGRRKKRPLFLEGYLAAAMTTYIASLKEHKVAYKNGPLWLTGLETTWRRQIIGINTLYSLPRHQATQLNLQDCAKFTGHSYRRSTAQHLVDQGVSSQTLKCQFNWASETMINEYVKQSVAANAHVSKMLINPLNPSLNQTPASGAPL